MPQEKKRETEFLSSGLRENRTAQPFLPACFFIKNILCSFLQMTSSQNPSFCRGSAVGSVAMQHDPLQLYSLMNSGISLHSFTDLSSRLFGQILQQELANSGLQVRSDLGYHYHHLHCQKTGNFPLFDLWDWSHLLEANYASAILAD